MESRPINGLQHTHVSTKSANEAQAKAPELNPKSMSALSPLHEWKEKERSRSYRLPDSLCNGAVKPFTIVVAVVNCLLDVAMSARQIGHSGELNTMSRCPH
jgi:hypothetical protein